MLLFEGHSYENILWKPRHSEIKGLEIGLLACGFYYSFGPKELIWDSIFTDYD